MSWTFKDEVYSNGTERLMFHRGEDTKNGKHIITYHVLTGIDSPKGVEWTSVTYVVQPATIPALVDKAWQEALSLEYGLGKTAYWQTWRAGKHVVPMPVPAKATAAPPEETKIAKPTAAKSAAPGKTETLQASFVEPRKPPVTPLISSEELKAQPLTPVQ